jgi:hypothetical protein
VSRFSSSTGPDHNHDQVDTCAGAQARSIHVTDGALAGAWCYQRAATNGNRNVLISHVNFPGMSRLPKALCR